MKKNLFAFLLLPTIVFSNSYCIYINQFDFNYENKSKIYSTLHDIAYPSIKIRNNQITVYSGKFKSFDDANKLLPLTRSRYKNAKVSQCDDSQKYRGKSLFSSDKKKIAIMIPKEKVERIIAKNYCIKVFESSLAQSTKQKQKINYILNRLPHTRTAVQNGKFQIYSGHFSSKKIANAIVKVLQREFKTARVVSCDVKPEVKPEIKETCQTRVQTTQKMVVSPRNEFSISELDEKGYIPAEIASNIQSYQNSQIEKSDVRDAFNSQREEYFNGLYLKTNTAYDVQNNALAYDIRLEFDMFDQGYFQNKKKNERNKIENQINFYKTLKNIEILKKGQEFLKIKKYENSVNVSALLLKLRVTDINRNQALLKIQNGTLTKYEYQGYLVTLQQIKDELLLFKNMALSKIPRDLWHLLNQIERVRLIDESRLIQALKKGSIDLKLVQTLQDSKPLGEGWRDKIRVNFYAGVRKMYLSQNQTLIGVEAKIPLSNYPKTQELDTIQNTIISEQAQLQHVQSQENLRDAIATFKYEQQKIKTYSFELSRIKQHIKDLEIINTSDYASYANISYDSEQKSDELYLQKYTQIQLERIATYKELIKIMYLIHSSNINEILSYSIK